MSFRMIASSLLCGAVAAAGTVVPANPGTRGGGEESPGATHNVEPCSVIAERQLIAINGLKRSSTRRVEHLNDVISADSVFRRCQRLDRGAVGILLSDVDANRFGTVQRCAVKALYANERGEVAESAETRTTCPEDVLVRERAGGHPPFAGENPPFVALRIVWRGANSFPESCESSHLVQLHFQEDVAEAISEDGLSAEIVRDAGASEPTDPSWVPVQWTDIGWDPDGRSHSLRLRLPGICVQVPLAYGGTRAEVSPGLNAVIQFDAELRAEDRTLGLRRSMSSACDEVGDMKHATAENMYRSAFCARLDGVPVEKIKRAWITRCDALAKVEEAWGKKYWTSGSGNISPEGEKTRPPSAPALCFREGDRIWDTDYTAQIHSGRPEAVMPDALASLLERVQPVLVGTSRR